LRNPQFFAALTKNQYGTEVVSNFACFRRDSFDFSQDSLPQELLVLYARLEGSELEGNSLSSYGRSKNKNYDLHSH
jgi:hypothetical protein